MTETILEKDLRLTREEAIKRKQLIDRITRKIGLGYYAFSVILLIRYLSNYGAVTLNKEGHRSFYLDGGLYKLEDKLLHQQTIDQLKGIVKLLERIERKEAEGYFNKQSPIEQAKQRTKEQEQARVV